MERTLTTLQKQALDLENFFPHFLREKAERLFFALSVFFLSFSVLFSIPIDTRFIVLWPLCEGLFLIFFALLLKTLLIEVYFQYLCDRLQQENNISFGTLVVLSLEPHKKDILKAFFHSPFGREVAKRLGLARESVEHFLKTKKVEGAKTNAPALLFHHFAHHLHDEHEELREFLTSNHVDKQDFVSVAEIVDQIFNTERKERAFFHPLFSKPSNTPLTFEAVTRKEIEQIEYLYRVIFTEKAIRNIILFFREQALSYASPLARNAFMIELVYQTISAHKGRHHGSSLILPSDVRTFIIHTKID